MTEYPSTPVEGGLWFERSTTVKAPIADVARFHSNSDGFKALAPPLVPMKIHRADDPLVEGSRLDFTMWLGPIPVYWESRILDVSEQGFTDIQEAGPFVLWEHRHGFEAIDEETTVIHDQIRAKISPNPIKMLKGLMMWLGLPVLFVWRHYRTRQSLENTRDETMDRSTS